MSNGATSPAEDALCCSIIVPVFNGEKTIVRCLDALACQTVEPHRYELIVVDDGSQDGTVDVVRDWARRHATVRLQLLQQENAGPAAARNHGAAIAASPLLLFTDADCEPTPHWIAALTLPFEGENVAGAKGTYLSRQQALTPRFVQAEYEDRYDRMAGMSQIDFIDTYSAAYRRDIFRENGGFDAIFTKASVEDQELSFRLARKGYRLVFAPGAQVYHIHDPDLREYVRRKYFIGYWKALLTRWHPERLVQDSHTPQVLKVQILLLAAVLATASMALLGLLRPSLLWFWALTVLLMALFIAVSMPFLAKLAHRSWRLALIGPAMLAARAAALGAGFLVGTVHFAGAVPGERRPVIPGWKRMAKRVIDIVGAFVGLIVSIPFVAVAAIAIKLDSPGPVIFRQVRVGKDGRRFRIMKLRSMVCDADARLDELIDINGLSEPVYKLPDDPRITRVGRVLRRTSLDEAPQFVNVLRGDMSLVGPRPEEERLVALYSDEQRRRLAVKPGMTGPMQVSGRGDLSLKERLLLELDYIDNYRLSRDFQILAQTVPAIVRGNGAY